MPSLPPFSGITALALLDDVSDACAVLDPKSGELLWQNAAWKSLCESLKLLGGILGDMPEEPMRQQLTSHFESLASVPTREVLRWQTGGTDAFETPILLHPYQADGRQLVAVLALAPRPAIALPNPTDSTNQLDPLTGLPGRMAIETRLQQYIQSPSTAPQFALLFLDLDGFKSVNDQWGHVAGDKVLTTVAARLAGAVRDRDLIVRYGGDEFLVLVADIHRLEELNPVISRLRQAAEEPVKYEDQYLQVSTSVGAALSTEGWRSAGDLINAADRRMYAEKHHASVASE